MLDDMFMHYVAETLQFLVAVTSQSYVALRRNCDILTCFDVILLNLLRRCDIISNKMQRRTLHEVTSSCDLIWM